MEVPAKNCLTVALQFLQKNGSLCFHYKTFCHCFVTLFRTKKISSWIFGTLTICTLIMNKLQISHMFNFKKKKIIMINWIAGTIMCLESFLRLFDSWANFPFTKKDTKHDYKTVILKLPHVLLNNLRIRILGY